MLGTNWKTTLGGILSLLGGVVGIGNMIVTGAIDPVQLSVAMAAIGSGWTGLMAKDHNVSNSPTPVVAKAVDPTIGAAIGGGVGQRIPPPNRN